MSIITNNPYQSPQLDAQSAAAGMDSITPINDAEQRQKATVSFAAWAGVLFGGSSGLAGALVLALSFGVLLGWTEFLSALTVEKAMLVLIIGSVLGVVCGLLIGPFVGSIVADRRHQLLALVASIVLSAFAGGMIGHLGTRLFVLRRPPPDARLAMIVGTAIGGLAGLLGGRQLGRGILAFGDEIETQSSD